MTTHVIGASLPRAGHHYLVRLLADVLRGELRYCEFYTPPDCCREVPCRRRDGASVVYQKSHDFDLTLPIGLPGVVYLVQTREPLSEAISDYELWRSVDPLLAADPRFLPLWLGRKAAYIRRFRRKWLEPSVPGRLVVHYEELRDAPAAVLERVLRALGRDTTPATVAAVVERQRGDRGGGIAYTARASDAAPQSFPSPLFRDFLHLLADEPGVDPLLTLVAEAHGAALDGNPGGALAIWETAWERFPDNPHVGGALWEHARRVGRESLAGELAATLAARGDAWPGTALDVANDLAVCGKHALALGLVDRALELDPRHPPSCLLRAHVLTACGRVAEAADAAADFVRLASVCDLLPTMSPEQRPLRANFRGVNRPANWQSAERFLDGRAGLEGDLAVARGMVAALVRWSAGEGPPAAPPAFPHAVESSPSATSRSAANRGAHRPNRLDILIAATQPIFGHAPTERLATGLAAVLERAGHRTERVRLPWGNDRQGHLDDLEALQLLEVPGRNQPERRVIALDLAAWAWASEARACLWLAESPPALPARFADAWRAWLRREPRGYAISATAAAHARRRYGLDLMPLYPPPPTPASLPGGTAAAREVEVVLRWQVGERPDLACGALAALPGRRLLVTDLPPDEAPIWRSSARAAGIEDRVELVADCGEPYLASARAVLVTVAEGADPAVALSALAAGRALVVAADTGAALEWIEDDAQGRIVAPRPDALAAALGELLDDPARRARFEACAELRSHDVWDWPRVLERLVGVGP